MLIRIVKTNGNIVAIPLTSIDFIEYDITTKITTVYFLPNVGCFDNTSHGVIETYQRCITLVDCDYKQILIFVEPDNETLLNSTSELGTTDSEQLQAMLNYYRDMWKNKCDGA